MRWGPLTLAICLLLSGCLVARGLAEDPGPADRIELVYGPSGELTEVGLLGPDGQRVLEATAGPPGQGYLSIAGLSPVEGPVMVTLVGDPLTDDQVDLVVEAGGERWVVEVAATPAGAWQGSGAHRVVASPLAGPEPELLVAAGPVILDGPGILSPRFDLLARVAMDEREAGGYTPVTLTLDGQTAARLVASGQDGQATVHHARVHAWQWPASDQTELAVRVERELAPGLIHETLVVRTSLLLDRQGPPAPAPIPGNSTVAWPAVAGATAYEAQARNGTEAWRPTRVTGTGLHPDAPLLPGHEVRVRAVDGVGNPGPWSQAVEIDPPRPPPPTPDPLPDRWPPLTPGAVVEGTIELTWPLEAPIVQTRLLIHAPEDGAWQPVTHARQPPLTWDTRTLPDGTYLVKLEVETSEEPVTRFFPGVTIDNLRDAVPGTLARQPQAPATDPPPVPEPTSPLPVLASLALLGLGGGMAAVALWRRTGTAK